jgi:putative ABC transport system permease protein
MFYFIYLRRELRRRMRQSIFIGLGLAIGIGLVITVMGASAGVKAAQSKVLTSLYGIGTALTVTTPPPRGSFSQSIKGSPSGTQICDNNVCHNVTGNSINQLNSPTYGIIAASVVARIARLRYVASAVGGLNLTDTHQPLPTASGVQLPTTFSVYGTDLADLRIGPFTQARLVSGHGFTSADADKDVAVIDSNFATGQKLTTGDKINVGGAEFTIIGIVKQAQGDNPPDVYIPMARAQALATSMTSDAALTGDVNTVYVTAASSTDIAAVQREIEALLPSATVTSQASLADEVTGSLTDAAKLINDLGKWLAIMVLITAFAVASLLTLGAVSRRVQEFGTLKAVGWHGGRIVSQVLGESLVTGVCGGIAGTGLGIAGIAILNAAAPKLSATLPSGDGASSPTISGTVNGVTHSSSAAPATHTILVPLSASVTADAIVLAILLAVAGGLLAGLFGGWRAARLRPAAALTAVA